MKKIFLTLLFLFVVPAVQAQNILPIGDSLTLGYAKYLTKGLVLVPVASVGARSEKILDNVRGSLAGLEAGNPKYVFILLGTNDAPGFIDPEPTKQNILSIVKLLRRADRKIYVSTLPPLKALNSIGRINLKIAELRNEVDGIVDQSEITVEMLTDRIHPNEDGYKIIACNFMKASGLDPNFFKPKVTPKANVPAKIPTRGKKCNTGDSLGFAPLRPDPGEPCEEFVPQKTVFACGSSITPLKQESFSPYGDSQGCSRVGTKVTCYKPEDFNVTIDLSKANLGILGNTQDQNLTDEQKINEYLSWYLSGVPQVGDQKKPDADKLINFSGPIRKLLPYDLSAVAKATIADQQSKTVHNYIVGPKDPLIGFFEGKNPLDPNIRLKDYQDENIIQKAAYWIDPTLFGPKLIRELINNNLLERLFQNIPYSSLEDTVGEYVVSATDLKRNNLQDSSIVDKTVKLTITSTQKAP